MRTASAAELAVLGSRSRNHVARIKVANGSGTLVDYSRWFNAAKISHDIDQPVSGATVSFIRGQANQYVVQSLSPFRTDSILNRLDDGTTYAPALDLNRRITIEVATTAIGAAVVAGDFKMLFDGTVDIVNFEKNPVVLECRDKGASLVDRWVETEAFYGTTPVGTAIETVMQDIIDAVFGGGVHTLYVPVSPSFLIVQYRQQKMSVMDALVDLVQLIGWDVRYKWDDGTSAFRLTLSEPPRTKTVPDYTFGPGAYIDIGQLGLELTNIRNVVSVSYKNSADLGNRAVVTVTDSASITKYGRRFFLIQEADSSPIDTTAEATTMANAALSDLKDPKAEQAKNAPLFWPGEINDLFRYSPNAVHFDSNQDWAVVEFDHEIAPDHMRTNFKVRGGPAGAYNSWLGRGGVPGGGGGVNTSFAPQVYIRPLNTEANDTTWDFRFSAVNGSGGGGANLTYTVKAKLTFGSETTLASGDESTLPRDLTINRDLKQGTTIRFTATDAATGMSAEAYYTVPVFTVAMSATGTFDADYIDDGATQRAVPFTVIDAANNFNIKGSGSTPGISSLKGLGTGGSIGIVGTDQAGLITMITGTGSAGSGGDWLRVTFAVAKGVAPSVVLQLQGNSGDTINIGQTLPDSTTTRFDVWTTGAPMDSRTYYISYVVLNLD